MSGVHQKKAIVMCGSSGIGFGIASQLKADGAIVGITGRSEARLKDACHRTGINHVASVDHSLPFKTKGAISGLITKLDGLDILVIHSPAPPRGPVETTTLEHWQDGFQKITLSAIEAIQASLPSLKKSTAPRIVFILSTAAKEPIPGLMVSSTLRAGMLGLMKSLSKELAHHQITVNAVLPGYTRTGDAVISGQNHLESLVPLGRLAEPFEHGKLVSFIASEEAAYITGQTIAVDGGFNKGI
jgi:3-oxoacyl-[acyl-carrier protein] reductase